MKIINRKTILATFFATMAIGSVHGQTMTHELNDELEIMAKILQTALTQDNQAEGIRLRSVGFTYLKHQGVLFQIDTNRSGSSRVFEFITHGSSGSVPMPPEAPQQFFARNGFDFGIDEDEIEDVVEQAMELAHDMTREAKSKLRSLGEKLREFSWEQREYERRRRDLEFEKNNSDKDRRQEIEQQLQELNDELKQIEIKRGEVERYRATLEKERKEQLEQRQLAQQQEYKQFLSAFEHNLTDVLCRYGAGLKALDGDEYVNFLLPNFSASTNNSRGKQDRIYVFKHKDIQACVRDKINHEKLLAGSNAYDF